MTATDLNLTEQVKGVLPVTNGGTGSSTLAGAGIPSLTAVQTFTNTRVQPRPNTVTSSATPSINVDTTDIFTITALAVAVTSMTSGLSGTPTEGQELLIRIKDNGTARAITWGTSFVSSGVATLLASTIASKTHLIGLIYDNVAAKFVCVACDSSGY